MRIKKSNRPVAQAVGIIAAVLALVVGVTYAALQSQVASLNGSTIVTAVADLQVSKDNTNFARSQPGFIFSGLIPGGSPQPATAYPVYVRNTGNAALSLKLSVKAGFTNQDNVDASKVHILIQPLGGGATQNVTLQDLVTADATGGLAIGVPGLNHLNAGSNSGWMLQVSLDADAVTGSSATLSELVFNINAVAVS